MPVIDSMNIIVTTVKGDSFVKWHVAQWKYDDQLNESSEYERTSNIAWKYCSLLWQETRRESQNEW